MLNNKLQRDKKVRFRLFKSGKLWLVATLTAVSLGTGIIFNVTPVSADATASAVTTNSVDSWMPDKNLQKAVVNELRMERSWWPWHNHQSLNGSNFTMYVGDPTPTAHDFNASAKDKRGHAINVSVDLSQAKLSTPGTYDVVLTAADGQKKTVKLTVLANKQSFAGSDFTAYVGDPKPTLTDFKASATGKDGGKVTVTADLSTVDMSKAGTYDVVLTAADSQTKTVKLTVLRKSPVPPIVYPYPEFSFDQGFIKDQTISQNQLFNPTAGIHAWTDSTHSTSIPESSWQISSSVDTSRPGSYTVDYTITNNFGRTATLHRTITVSATGYTESKMQGIVYVKNSFGAILYSNPNTTIPIGKTLIIATAWKYYSVVRDANGKIVAYNLGGKQYVKATDMSTSPIGKYGVFTVHYPANTKWSIAVYDSNLKVLKLIPANSSWRTYGIQTLSDGRAYFNLGGDQFVRVDYGYWNAK